MKMECLELVAWKPKRKHAANREPTRHVVGITNYDKCGNKYWAIAEVDRSMSLEELLRAIPPWAGKPLIIYRTRKGYHVYLDYSSSSPLKVYHMLMRVRVFERGHLKLAKARSGEDYGKLILRISPKYNKPDIYPVYIGRGLSTWHQQVLLLTALLQAKPEVVEKWLSRGS